MQKGRVFWLLSFLLACLVGSPLVGDEQPRLQEGYGLTKVWSIDLTLSEKEYAAMQPALPGPPGAPLLCHCRVPVQVNETLSGRISPGPAGK